jgi:hypothetical protein
VGEEEDDDQRAGGRSQAPAGAARGGLEGCYPGVMQVTYTAAGTPIIDLTPEEYAAHLEREVQSAMGGMSVAEFTRAYTAGELDDADVAVDEMVGLLRIGQNGHKAAA